jgi:protein-S-isoprenylcysteine O-methyltransferase Ste14
MPDPIRVWFLVLWSLGLIGFSTSALKFRSQMGAVEKHVGLLPTPIPFAMHIIAVVLLATGFGMLSVDATSRWQVLRWAGVAVSLYSVVVLPWTLRTLGRLAVPGAGVLRDHSLITTGPFRLIRNPLYSAVSVLWLGAALGTLDWPMMVLFPLLVFGLLKTARAEEGLLREKFGAEYDAYVARTGRIVPKFAGQ